MSKLVFKGAIFDMDGLLVDSEVSMGEIYEDLFKELDIVLPDEYFNRIMGTNRQYERQLMISYLQDEKKVDKFFELFTERLYQYYRENKIALKKGAQEILLWLKKNNIPFGLATSSPIEAVELAFSDREIKVSDFTAIVTGPEVSKSKPDPEIFLIAAQKINVDIKDCLVLEDSYNGIRAAIASKATPILVIDTFKPSDQLRKEIGYVFNSLVEVLDLIKGNNEED